MSQSTVTIIIILCTCALYLTEKLPVALVTVMGMLAMVFTGVLSYSDAFGCFASTNVMLVLGMIIIVNALLESGVGRIVGNLLSKLIGQQEKLFVVIVFLSASVISLFSTNAALVAMYMPFIASISVTSGGAITKKNTYLPLAIGGLIGGTGSLAGSTAPLLANDVLAMTGADTMGFFTPFPIAAAMVIVVALCYWLFLYDLQKKWFDFPEEPAPIANDIEEIPLDKRKALICVTVFVICIALFIIQPFGWSLGLISITGAVVLVLAGCVDGKHALKHMQWSALVTLGAALAIAKGFVDSGVGEIIMEKLTVGLGSWIANPVALVTIFLLAGFILSQFMANGALVSMMAAIAVPMAVETGTNPMPVALACVFGCSLAMATPVATTTITMVQVAGYRFKDYLRAGGLTSLIALVTAWAAILVQYRLIF